MFNTPVVVFLLKKKVSMGAQKTGALIIFERKDRLREFVTGGISI